MHASFSFNFICSCSSPILWSRLGWMSLSIFGTPHWFCLVHWCCTLFPERKGKGDESEREVNEPSLWCVWSEWIIWMGLTGRPLSSWQPRYLEASTEVPGNLWGDTGNCFTASLRLSQPACCLWYEKIIQNFKGCSWLRSLLWYCGHRQMWGIPKLTFS